MEDIQNIRQVIKDRINNDIDWANPYWLDEVREEYPDVPESVIDGIYAAEMKYRVDCLGKDEAQAILEEQTSLTSANQNFLLENLLEEKLELIN
jgi:hypothetical protein